MTKVPTSNSYTFCIDLFYQKMVSFMDYRSASYSNLYTKTGSFCKLLTINKFYLFKLIKNVILNMDKNLQHQIWHDDPKNWKLGFIYFNKADHRWFPPKRAGFGYTLNFAHPVSYLYLLLIAALAFYVKQHKK